MHLLIDMAAAQQFTLGLAMVEQGDHRRYYRAHAPARMIVACRGDMELFDLVGQVVDAEVGWDMGIRYMVRNGNEGQRHSKITIYRKLYEGRGKNADYTLSGLLKSAPRDEEG